MQQPDRPFIAMRASWAIAAFTLLCGLFWAGALALAQPIPPPRGSVAPNGDYAYSGSYKYDPSTCSRDPQGTVYFAVGRTVLRQPVDNLSITSGQSPSERRAAPRPPRPDEPWGCPDHPLQAATYTLLRVSAMPGDPPSPVAAEADAISAIVHDGNPYRRNDRYEAFCNRPQPFPPDNSIPGFAGCRSAPSINQVGAYQALDYAGPDGVKVALACNVGRSDTIERGVCEGGYLLRERFTVNFTFGVTRLPIARFPEADVELQRRLGAAVVRDFDWAQEPAATPSNER